MKNTNAINFLLFSYFGFTLEDCKAGKWDKDNGILGKIIDKAYKDATQQGAFNAMIDIDSEKLKKLRKVSAEIIADGISELLKAETTDDYDRIHMKICSNKDKGNPGLVESYNSVKNKDNSGENAFTYGNAQKWINMTMKYLYVVNQICEEYLDKKDYSNEEYKEHFFVKIQKIKYIENKLHVPVDSYIIQGAWEEKTVQLPLKDERKGYREKDYKNPADYVKAWSKWDNEPKENALGDYSAFQTSLKESIGNRIDWECQKWIEVAKKRRGEEK